MLVPFVLVPFRRCSRLSREPKIVAVLPLAPAYIPTCGKMLHMGPDRYWAALVLQSCLVVQTGRPSAKDGLVIEITFRLHPSGIVGRDYQGGRPNRGPQFYRSGTVVAPEGRAQFSSPVAHPADHSSPEPRGHAWLANTVRRPFCLSSP